MSDFISKDNSYNNSTHSYYPTDFRKIKSCAES